VPTPKSKRRVESHNQLPGHTGAEDGTLNATILRWAVLGSFLKIQLWAQENLLHHPSWNSVRRLGEPEMIIVLWDKLWPKHFQIKEGLQKATKIE